MMYADEADQDGSKEFLVYAGVFFPLGACAKLTFEIANIRQTVGYLANDSLKSSESSRPKQVSRENFAHEKNHVLELAVENGVKICCYIIPNSIAAGQEMSKRLELGANTLIGKFNDYLEENSSKGFVQFDRTDSFRLFPYFQEIFSNGISFPSKTVNLHNILSYSVTCDQASHLASMTDVIVGAFRFVVNERDKDKVGSKLWSLLAPLMWCKTAPNGVKYIRERGLCIRPMDIKKPEYIADIDALVTHLTKYNQNHLQEN